MELCLGLQTNAEKYKNFSLKFFFQKHLNGYIYKDYSQHNLVIFYF